MTAETPHCIYCHDTLEGVKYRDLDHLFVCDACMAAIKAPTPAGRSPHYAKTVLTRETSE